MWGTRIGFVAQEDGSAPAQFSYDAVFLNSGIEVSPLMMPLSGRLYSFPELNGQTFFGLPGLLADSLPDRFGTKLISRYLAEQGRSIDMLTAVERLCYTGSRGMGALEYVPAKRYADAADGGKIDVDALVRLASDVLSERKSLRAGRKGAVMEQMLRVGTSAGGARAKAVIAWNEKTGEIRSGQVDAGEGFEYRIIKFDQVDNNKDHGDRPDGPAYTRIEYAYYLMARAAGIEMNACSLLQENGRYHFMTRRFDRLPDTGGKLHMQTLGAMAHFDYNEPGAHSYEEAAGVIWRLGMGQSEVTALFRRMVFHVMARNRDDHVKNISFLMDRTGTWHLSPAYDETFAWDPHNYWLARHQMSVNGKREEIEESDLHACGRHMNLGKRQIETVIAQVRDAVNRWETHAGDAQVPEPEMEEIRRAICNQ
ncbi:MAG: type II toxin-antitoxin system HipA family toxin [Lachnospiraceae bacterium]|nr:type II toxin-antitoxin system HipA family toxin [Lachnospiraceae bacterium]